jgi:hypothetical protein
MSVDLEELRKSASVLRSADHRVAQFTFAQYGLKKMGAMGLPMKLLLGLLSVGVPYTYFRGRESERKRFSQGYNLAMQQLRPWMGQRQQQDPWGLAPSQRGIQTSFPMIPTMQ